MANILICNGNRDIARSLVELQKGLFSLSVDGNLFKTELRFDEIASS